MENKLTLMQYALSEAKVLVVVNDAKINKLIIRSMHSINIVCTLTNSGQYYNCHGHPALLA